MADLPFRAKARPTIELARLFKIALKHG